MGNLYIALLFSYFIDSIKYKQMKNSYKLCATLALLFLMKGTIMFAQVDVADLKNGRGLAISDNNSNILRATDVIMKIDKPDMALASLVYFTDVVWGGNGLDHHNIMVNEARINGVALVAGDEIGIYDERRLVGASVVTETMDGTNAPLNIKTSKDDPITSFVVDGFVAGNAIKFKIYKNSEGKVYEVGTPVYTSGETVFTANGLSEVEINADDEIEQVTQLAKGWNAISFFVMPTGNPNVSDILHLIEPGEFGDTMVQAKDEAGNVIFQTTDDIGQMALSEGYNVKVAYDTSLSLRGIKSTINAIKLIPGWNIMGYPFSFEAEADSVLYNLMDISALVKIQNEKGQSIEFLGSPINSWVKGFSVFQPGKGYKINVNNNIASPGDDSIHFDHVAEGQLFSMKAPSFKVNIPTNNYSGFKAGETTHFVPGYPGNGLEHMNIYIPVSEIKGIELNDGDEVAAYDGNICVGSVKYRSGMDIITIIASKDDPTTQAKDGFTVGDDIQVRIWTQIKQQESALIEECVLGQYQASYKAMGTTVLGLRQSIVGYEITKAGSVSVSDAYPNPFNGSTTIWLSVSEQQKVTLVIYDLLGKQLSVLADGVFDEGTYELKWNGTDAHGADLPEGMYLYVLTTSDKTVVKRLSKLK
jgi:flagellar hook assembly protein FlgD